MVKSLVFLLAVHPFDFPLPHGMSMTNELLHKGLRGSKASRDSYDGRSFCCWSMFLPPIQPVDSVQEYHVCKATANT